MIRLFAAHLPEETRGPVIARELQERASAEGRFDFDRDGYAQHLRAIRACGYEVTLDAPIPGVSAVAVPVFDFTQEIQLAVTVIGPTPLCRGVNQTGRGMMGSERPRTSTIVG